MHPQLQQAISVEIPELRLAANSRSNLGTVGRTLTILFGCLLKCFLLFIISAAVACILSPYIRDWCLIPIVLPFWYLLCKVNQLVVWQLRERRASQEIKKCRLVLGLAKLLGGSLTASDVLLNCQLTTADTRKTLEQLGMDGYCQVEMAASGELLYEFPSYTAGGRNKIEMQNRDQTTDEIS